MLLKIKIIILTLQLFYIQPSWSACENMTFLVYPSQVNLNTNNFQKLDIEVNKGDGECDNYFIVVDNGNASSSLTRSLQAASAIYPVQFYKDSSLTQILKSEFEATASDVIAGSFMGSPNQSRTAFYVNLKVNQNGLIPFGYYSQNYKLKLFEASFGSALLRDQKIINVSYIQNRIAELSLVSTGSNFTQASLSQSLDFGELTEGSTRGFDMIMLHNAGYAISMSSLNSGKLKHETKNNYVTYDLIIDGWPVSISSAPSIIKSGYGLSPSGGTRLPVLVKIGSVAKAQAGTYSDIITISVASTE